MRWSLLVILAGALVFSGCKDGGNAQAEKPKAEAQKVEEQKLTGEESWGYAEKVMDNPTEKAPLEIVEGYDYDLGTMLDGVEKRFSITVKNTSDKPWRLHSINASCACTTVVGVPGGRMMQPNEVWKVQMKVDSSRISVGEFEKKVIFTPAQYLPVVLKFHGVVEPFADYSVKSRRIDFKHIRSANEQWEKFIVITGMKSAADVLELGTCEGDEYIGLTMEKLKAGSWKITARPKKPLPYGERFSRRFKIPVLKPEGYPEVPVTVVGKVGTSLNWEGPRYVLHADFEGKDTVELSFILGFDPEKSTVSAARQRTIDRYVDKIDWSNFKDTLQLKFPEGVEYHLEKVRYGVRMTVKVRREHFSDKKALTFKSGCNGNWEIKDMTVELRKQLPKKPYAEGKQEEMKKTQADVLEERKKLLQERKKALEKGQ